MKRKPTPKVPVFGLEGVTTESDRCWKAAKKQRTVGRRPPPEPNGLRRCRGPKPWRLGLRRARVLMTFNFAVKLLNGRKEFQFLQIFSNDRNYDYMNLNSVN